MTRTHVLLALGFLLLLGSESPAQPGAPAKPERVGVVHLGERAEAPVVVGLRQGLRDLGYLEGRDVVLEIRLQIRSNAVEGAGAESGNGLRRRA